MLNDAVVSPNYESGKLKTAGGLKNPFWLNCFRNYSSISSFYVVLIWAVGDE